MRRGTPGVVRKRVEASDRVDASHRLVCSHGSTCDRAECLFAVSPLQLAKRVRAAFELDQGLLRRRSMCGDFLLSIERLDPGSLMKGVWQSAHFIGNQYCMAHRLRAQPRSAFIFRPLAQRPNGACLACDLGQTRRVVERMQCARESLLLLLGLGRSARFRYEFPRLAQCIAGLCY